MKNWFKKHKRLLIVVAVLIGGPPATVYVNVADAAIELSEVAGQ
ncbi:hypothetical protein [Arsukibacterium sp.]